MNDQAAVVGESPNRISGGGLLGTRRRDGYNE